jgi:hypothetical protein
LPKSEKSLTKIKVHYKDWSVSGAGSLTAVKWMWTMKKGVVGLPCLLILFKILMQQCKQRDMWVLLSWKYSLIFLEAPFGTLFMNVWATETFLVIWLTNSKDSHGIIPDDQNLWKCSVRYFNTKCYQKVSFYITLLKPEVSYVGPIIVSPLLTTIQKRKKPIA